MTALTATPSWQTLAAQGYRLRVPYGTLLCVSDKPLHGEIKLPGTANAFYQRAGGEHLRIGIAALDLLRGDLGALHSRKLRSFGREAPAPVASPKAVVMAEAPDALGGLA